VSVRKEGRFWRVGEAEFDTAANDHRDGEAAELAAAGYKIY
jgi:hypothetical protein